MIDDRLENKLLNESNNLKDFLTTFFELSRSEQLEFFPDKTTIYKGEYLYRARKADQNLNELNYNEPKQWGLAPREIVRQGRFNSEHNPVLYVASSPDFLEDEIGLNVGDEYYLAKYKCKSTFKVGNFLTTDSRVNTLLHKIALSVNSIDYLPKETQKLINDYYNAHKNNSLIEISGDLVAPFYINRCIPDLYNWTNKLGDLLLTKNNNGIRYCSAYSLEVSGYGLIVTMEGDKEGNFALTSEGYSNIELVSVEKKKRITKPKYEIMIETFIESNMRENLANRYFQYLGQF